MTAYIDRYIVTGGIVDRVLPLWTARIMGPETAMAAATCSYPSCPGYPMPLDARVCRGCGAPAHHLCQIAFETTHDLEETLLKWCPDCRLRDAGVVDRAHGPLPRGSFADVGDNGSGVSDCHLDLFAEPTDCDSDKETDSSEAQPTDSAKAQPTAVAQAEPTASATQAEPTDSAAQAEPTNSAQVRLVAIDA